MATPSTSTLPAQFHFSTYRDPTRVPVLRDIRFEFGPILYAVMGASKVDFKGYRGPQEIERALKPVDGMPLHYRARGNANLTVMPYWQVDTEEFSCFPAFHNEQG
jgi:hypothetical protein